MKLLIHSNIAVILTTFLIPALIIAVNPNEQLTTTAIGILTLGSLWIVPELIPSASRHLPRLVRFRMGCRIYLGLYQ